MTYKARSISGSKWMSILSGYRFCYPRTNQYEHITFYEYEWAHKYKILVSMGVQ